MDRSSHDMTVAQALELLWFPFSLAAAYLILHVVNGYAGKRADGQPDKLRCAAFVEAPTGLVVRVPPLPGAHLFLAIWVGVAVIFACWICYWASASVATYVIGSLRVQMTVLHAWFGGALFVLLVAAHMMDSLRGEPSRIRYAPDRVARVESTGEGARVYIPPVPGARRFAAYWGCALAFLGAYVCFLAKAEPRTYVFVMSSCAAMAGMTAMKARDAFPTFVELTASGELSIARISQRRIAWRGQLSRGVRSTVVVRRADGRSWIYWSDLTWAQISREEAKLLEASGLDSVDSAPRRLRRWTFLNKAYSVIGGAFALWVAHLMAAPLGMTPTWRTRLEGSFAAQDARVGTWQLTPVRCLSGRERGFEGVLFSFAKGSPVRELRVDVGTPDADALELVFAGPEVKTFRITSDECERFDSQTDARVIRFNGRDMDALRGTLHIACARYKLEGHASYEGCLP